MVYFKICIKLIDRINESIIMKNTVFVLLVALTPVWVSGQKTMKDANVEVRNVGSFHAIHISNAFDLYLTQAGEEAVAVSAAQEKHRDKITTKVVNGVLIISFNDKSSWFGNKGNKKLKAYVSFKSINKLKVSGACDVYVNGSINAEKLDLSISGASDIRSAEIFAESMTVSLNGASDIRQLKGKVTRLRVEAHGASDFHGYDLQTEYCDAEAHGASDIRISVSKELNARASGASDIHYKGAASLRSSKSGTASGVSRRG